MCFSATAKILRDRRVPRQQFRGWTISGNTSNTGVGFVFGLRPTTSGTVSFAGGIRYRAGID